MLWVSYLTRTQLIITNLLRGARRTKALLLLLQYIGTRGAIWRPAAELRARAIWRPAAELRARYVCTPREYCQLSLWRICIIAVRLCAFVVGHVIMLSTQLDSDEMYTLLTCAIIMVGCKLYGNMWWWLADVCYFCLSNAIRCSGVRRLIMRMSRGPSAHVIDSTDRAGWSICDSIDNL